MRGTPIDPQRMVAMQPTSISTLMAHLVFTSHHLCLQVLSALYRVFSSSNLRTAASG
jgi:hypothetical protein